MWSQTTRAALGIALLDYLVSIGATIYTVGEKGKKNVMDELIKKGSVVNTDVEIMQKDVEKATVATAKMKEELAGFKEDLRLILDSLSTSEDKLATLFECCEFSPPMTPRSSSKKDDDNDDEEEEEVAGKEDADEEFDCLDWTEIW